MSIERRFHPRKDVDFSVVIVLNNTEQRLSGTAVNLSLSGIQLCVDKSCVDHILSQHIHPTQFQIIIDDKTTVQSFTTRLIVNRRTSQNQYLLGLKFIGLTPEQSVTIETLYNQ